MSATRLLSGLMLAVSVSLAFSWAAGASGRADSEFSPIEPGWYQMGSSDMQFSLDLGAAYWLVNDSDPHKVVFTDPGPSGPIGRDVVVATPSRLAGPSADTTKGDWSLDNINGWLNGLSSELVVGEPVETTLGGRPAVQFDIRLRAGTDGGTFSFTTTADGAQVSFEAGREYRVWWIDGADETPVVVIASNDIGEHSILPQADTLLSGLMFDSPSA